MFCSFPNSKKKEKQKFFPKITLKENSPYSCSVTVGQHFVKKLISVKPIINTVYFS